VKSEICILSFNKGLCLVVGIRNLISALKQGNKIGVGLMTNKICLLLLLLWVDDKCARGHGTHVAVLTAYVDVNRLRLKFILIGVKLELVNTEVTSRLDQHGEREV
jgi:hypothetical protein